MDSIEEGIVELISQHGMRELVMGAAATTKNASFSCIFLSGVYKNATIEWL